MFRKTVMLSPDPVPVSPPPELACEIYDRMDGQPGAMGSTRHLILHFHANGQTVASFSIAPLFAKALGRALVEGAAA